MRTTETDSQKQERGGIEGLPDWAPFLNVRDVATLLRTTPAAVRQAIEAKDDLGRELLRFQIKLTPHRRLFKKRALLDWLHSREPELVETA